jgi:hypothetical protein
METSDNNIVDNNIFEKKFFYGQLFEFGLDHPGQGWHSHFFGLSQIPENNLLYGDIKEQINSSYILLDSNKKKLENISELNNLGYNLKILEIVKIFGYSIAYNDSDSGLNQAIVIINITPLFSCNNDSLLLQGTWVNETDSYYSNLTLNSDNTFMRSLEKFSDSLNNSYSDGKWDIFNCLLELNLVSYKYSLFDDNSSLTLFRKADNGDNETITYRKML